MNETNETAQVSLDVAPHKIVTTRVLHAPRALVWRAFTEPAHMVHWWGPQGFTTTVHEMQVRPGGVCRHTMHGPDGRDWPNHMVYTEVVEPEWLAWAHGTEPGGEPWFHASVRLATQGEGTLLTLTHIFPSGEARDFNIATYGSLQGAKDTLERLAGHLRVMPPAPGS
jgi:uncharacterized protein YndB with AHSA1/START domain